MSTFRSATCETIATNHLRCSHNKQAQLSYSVSTVKPQNLKTRRGKFPLRILKLYPTLLGHLHIDTIAEKFSIEGKLALAPLSLSCFANT